MPKKKILIIDDEKSFVQMVKLNLEEAGEFEVKTQTDAKEAVDTALEFKPDLILLDIIMPDIDGAQVAQEIESQATMKDTPIVFLTAIVKGEEVISQGALIGGHRFVAKPVSTDKLIEIIHKNIKK